MVAFVTSIQAALYIRREVEAAGGGDTAAADFPDGRRRQTQLPVNAPHRPPYRSPARLAEDVKVVPPPVSHTSRDLTKTSLTPVRTKMKLLAPLANRTVVAQPARFLPPPIPLGNPIECATPRRHSNRTFRLGVEVGGVVGEGRGGGAALYWEGDLGRGRRGASA